MVTKIVFKDKKQKRTSPVDGETIRFKNGEAKVTDDKKQLKKKLVR